MKNTQSKVKPIKTGRKFGTTYCLGCKDLTHNFNPQEVKMTNKVLREKSNCVVCRSNKSRFLKQKHDNNKRSFNTLLNNVKNKMKNYCMKCRKDTENIDAKMVRTKKR